jgi:hypothetical protein
MLEVSQNLGEKGCHAEHPLYSPKISSIMDIFYDQNFQIIFPKGVYRTPPENAFMNVYFYFYCVVKCGNCALGINECIKNLVGHKNEPKPTIVVK